jgi:hypothetical protein
MSSASYLLHVGFLHGYSSTLKLQVETSVAFQLNTRDYIREDGTL